MTALTITSSMTGGYHLSNTAANPVTVASGVTITNFAYPALYATQPAVWTIANYGTLLSTGAFYFSDGISLFSGGTITNATGGSVTGYYAGVSVTGAGLVVNAGSLVGTGTFRGYGVILASGGTVTNAQGGVIYGGVDGVRTGGQASTVVNQGSIGGHNDVGVELLDGGLVSNASGGTIAGGRYGVFVGTGNTGTVTNAGFIYGYTAAGAVLLDGGTLDNEKFARVIGLEDGIFTSGSVASTISNAGGVYGFDFTGVFLDAGGSLTNTGRVSGQYYGVIVSNSPGTVVNAGSISASLVFKSTDTAFDSAAVLLADGGVVTNSAGGVITSNWMGVQVLNASGTVINAGTIAASAQFLPANTTFVSAGVQLADGGVVTNATGGTITSYSMGVQIFNAAGTVVNAGSISASAQFQAGETAFASAGVQLPDGGVVTNSTGGVITSNWTGVQIFGASGTVANLGTISAWGQFQPANTLLAPAGVQLANGGMVTNAAIGEITSEWIGVELYGAAGTVINQGTILASEDGIFTDGFAASTVSNTGTVFGYGYTGAWLDTGGHVTNAGTIFGHYFGVKVSNATGTVVNAGSVSDVASGTGAGVQLADGGVVTNSVGGQITSEWMGVQIGASRTTSVGGTVVNYGTIVAADGPDIGAGIWIHGPGAITNAVGGLISGGPFGIVAYYQTTVVNQGTIFGTADAFYARYAGFADRVIDTPGAVFSGVVSGGNTLGSAIYSTLELASGSSTGTITNVATFVDFGQIALDAGASWLLGGSLVAGETIAFGGADASLILANPSAAAATITGFAATDTIVLSGTTDVTGLSFDGDTVTVTESGNAGLILQFTSPQDLTYAVADGSTDIFDVPCFLPGTHILTSRGEVPVEQLRVGDSIVTASGGTRPLCWIGQGRTLATRGRRGPATPVIVRKGALADNVPHRDLHITKGHSLYLDGVLIPVEFLVNHRSILWDDRAQEVTVFHLELDAHDVLLANGAPSESYRDDGNRWLFQNANAGWDQPPKAACAPVRTGGAQVDAIWQRILHRAGPRPGLPLTGDPDLHLRVDGVRVDGVRVDGVRVDAGEQQGSVWVFRLSERPASVHIVSREAVPAELGLARDARSLGVALRSVAVRQGTKFVALKPGDARLTDGFHAHEAAKNLRWTDGYASVPVELFARFEGGMEVVLDVAETTRYPNDGTGLARVAA